MGSVGWGGLGREQWRNSVGFLVGDNIYIYMYITQLCGDSHL